MTQYCQSLISISHSVSTRKTDAYSLHCHPFCEIYYFLSGDVDYLVEGVYYHPAPHSLLLLSPFFSPRIYVNSARAYLPYLSGLYACSGLPAPASDECAQAHLIALLGQLRLELGEAAQPESASQNATLTQQVISYLSLHLAQHNTLDSLAKRFFVSRSHLSRAFYHETGASVSEYIRRKRLIYADTLRRHGMSATEAALKAGFGDYSTYYRTLKREQGNDKPVVQ